MQSRRLLLVALFLLPATSKSGNHDGCTADDGASDDCDDDDDDTDGSGSNAEDESQDDDGCRTWR